MEGFKTEGCDPALSRAAEDLDRGERRPVRERVHRRESTGGEVLAETGPDAGVAQHTVQQEDRRLRGRGTLVPARIDRIEAAMSWASMSTMSREKFSLTTMRSTVMCSASGGSV